MATATGFLDADKANPGRLAGSCRVVVRRMTTAAALLLASLALTACSVNINESSSPDPSTTTEPGEVALVRAAARSYNSTVRLDAQMHLNCDKFFTSAKCQPEADARIAKEESDLRQAAQSILATGVGAKCEQGIRQALINLSTDWRGFDPAVAACKADAAAD